MCQHEVGQEKIDHNLKEIINSMSYTLGLLFEYHRYQHDAIVRIYADDRLVDELSLSSNINLKCVNASDMIAERSLIGPRNYTHVFFTPEKLFMFEIDEQHLCNRIRIEVQNRHNNNTNGFMTEFSYIKFDSIFLFPSCMLEVNNWLRIRKRIDRWFLENGIQYTNYDNDSFPRRLSSNDVTLRPDPRQKNDDILKYVLGGSFSMDIPLSRKHGLIHLGRLRPGRVEFYGYLSRVLCAFNQLNTSV